MITKKIKLLTFSVGGTKQPRNGVVLDVHSNRVNEGVRGLQFAPSREYSTCHNTITVFCIFRNHHQPNLPADLHFHFIIFLLFNSVSILFFFSQNSTEKAREFPTLEIS
ncbi:hypothetical protein VNO77_24103 [Canavalia gladiata]|uniref:Uncharacterized protein n=1 Tax=Canavalia gladiata TaxID=3824 RepID=A0AAN9L6X1_CANGL